MNITKKILLLASCGALLLSGAMVANANSFEHRATPVTKTARPQAVQNILSTSGKILEVNDNVLVVKGEHSLIAAVISDETYLLNGKNGKAKRLNSFKVGKEVTVYHSPKMTRSIPAQTEAYAIVLNEGDVPQGRFLRAEKVALSEDGKYVRVVDTNHGFIVTVDKKACRNYADIKPEDNLMVWFDTMTLSIPARANATKAVVLP